MRIVCLSDTHNRTDGLVVPEGDLLLHAGDLTSGGSEDEVAHAFLVGRLETRSATYEALLPWIRRSLVRL